MERAVAARGFLHDTSPDAPICRWVLDGIMLDELLRYIAAQIEALLDKRDFLMALPGHLPGDAASQARLPELIRRLRAIAQLGRADQVEL